MTTKKEREEKAAKRRAAYARSKKVGAKAVRTQLKKRQQLKEAGNWNKKKKKKG